MEFAPAGTTDRSNGPGQRNHLTNGTCEKAEYKLHVSNLPSELNEDGIREIFNTYGNVIAILVPRDASWAYVSYKTHKEALLAIGHLDNKSPLNLKVQFSKERQTKKINDWTKKNIPEPVSSEETTIAPDYRESGEVFLPGFLPARMQLPIPERVRTRNLIPHYNIQDDILYPVEHDSKMLNPFENAYPYPETNLLWTRGRITYTPNGRRQIVMGRGVPYYEIPNHYPRMEDNVSSLYERRTNEMYEYGDDQLRSEIGRCDNCGIITKMRCSKCTTFYCSRVCQKNDWDRHKIECLALPALTGVPNPVQDQELKLKERVTILNQKARERSDAYQKMPNSQPSRPEKEQVKNYEEKEPVKITEPIKCNLEIETNAKPEPQQVENKITEIPRKPQSTSSPKSKIDYQKVEEEIAFQKVSFLPKDKFVKVVVTIPLPNCEYFIQKSEDSSEFILLMKSLEASKVAPKAEPKVGALIASKYFDIWHRASIVSLDPLTVHYIDYGNVEILEDTDIRDLGTLKTIPYYSRKISIQNGQGTKYESLKENDALFVKMISENSDGVITVVVAESENDSVQGTANERTSQRRESGGSRANSVTKSPAGSYKKSTPRTPQASEEVVPSGNILDNLLVGDKGQVELHTHLGENRFSVTILPRKFLKWYKKILEDTPIECQQKAATKSYNPTKIGELILGQRQDNDWVRGQVLSIEKPVRVAAVDEGRVCLVNHCLEAPAELANICTFGAACILPSHDMKPESLQVFNFEVVSTNAVEGEKQLELMLTSDSQKSPFKAHFTAWKPPPEQIGIKNLELKTNTEVVLSAFRSPSLIYVRSLETSEIERFNKLMQQVHREAQTAPKLTEMPVVGEMVIALFTEDKNYYRAIVTKIDGEAIHITYADYGNVEVSSLQNLSLLSDDLKKCPTGSAKIVLKGVPTDVTLNKELAVYLENLSGTEQPLKMTFDGVPSEDGVELKTASQKSVNETVMQLLTPVYKNPEQDKTCYMLNDMETVPLGEKGSTITAYVLHTQTDGSDYFLCPYDETLLGHISNVLPQKLQEYADSVTEHYIPRNGELCIAPFSGGWYRAACLQRNVTKSSSSVFFVDYGNMDVVNQTDMKLMTTDFITPPALANICKVQNLLPKEYEKEIPANILDRIKLLVAPNSAVKVKIVDFDSENNYVVEFPEIRNILLKEKLI